MKRGTSGVTPDNPGAFPRHRLNSVTDARGVGDVESAAEILLRAFADQENARMGPRYVRAFLMTFHTQPRRVLLVASSSDRIAGFAAGEPGSCKADRYRSLRTAAALALLSRPWLLLSPSIVRMALARLNADSKHRVPEGAWFLALLGVDPELARTGIGHQLLSAFEEEGRRRGFRSAALLVSESNHAARALYELSGWQTDEQCLDGRILYMKSLALE